MDNKPRPTSGQVDETTQLATLHTPLDWFNNEDGNIIVGTHNRNVADPFHDTQIDGMLWGMNNLEEFYARNLDTITYLYLRPDWETADENTNLNINPASGKPCTKYNGIPAIWYKS